MRKPRLSQVAVFMNLYGLKNYRIEILLWGIFCFVGGTLLSQAKAPMGKIPYAKNANKTKDLIENSLKPSGVC